MKRMHYKSIIATLFAICCLIYPTVVSAQTVDQGSFLLKGTVVDSKNVPLVGAVVKVLNTNQGVATNLDGGFTLNVNSDAQISISYLGFENQTIKVGRQRQITIVMHEDAMQMKEVVVIGYGTVKKKDLTGSIQSVSGNELVKAMNTNITESLNGRVGGVLVNKTSNRPGSDMYIEIRGINSFNNSNEPLYVIDGVPSSTGMRHINASDIESIDILKDASSSAIYGSRGANGVIIITTKGANRKEGFTIDYNGYFGIKTPTRIPDMIGNKGNGMDFYNYRTTLWKKIYGPNSIYRDDFLTTEEKKRIKNGEFYDWLREVSNDSYVTNHSIAGSGGSEKTSYTAGLSYMLDEGMVGNEKFERYTANIGLEHRVSDKFKLGISAYLSATDSDLGSNEALINAYFIPPIVSPYDKDGSYLFHCQPNSSKINPFIQIENSIRKREEFYANAFGFLEYRPIEGLALKTQVAYQHNSDQTGEWNGTYTQAKGGVNKPSASRWEGRNMNIVWDNTVTYAKTFADKHQLNVIGLYSMQEETHKNSSMSVDGLPYESMWHAMHTADEITGISSSYWESKMISGMIRANYTFDDKYLFTFTGRYDGTSRLASGNQWGFMPSVAVGWQMKNESFLKNINTINNLKLRLSWGRSGNNSIGHDITWTKLAQNRYSFNDKGENTFGLSSVKGNKDLRWEMTSEWNLGLDFGFFNNRISGTIDAYSRKTKDLIMARSVGRINGFETIWENIGTTGNKGIEISLNTINVSIPDFSWRSGITFSLNRNKIIDLYGDKKDDLANRWFIGHPMRVDYNLKHLGIWQEEEAEEAKRYGQVPGQIKVWDKDDNGSIDEEDYSILSSVGMPSWTGGLSNTFTYRDFDLSVFVYARIGGYYGDNFTYGFTSNDNEHWNKLDVEYWTPENRSNKWPSVGAQSYYTQVLGRVSGTFVKIQNITLGYTLPQPILKKFKMQNARVYGTVQNPFTFTKYLGSDPEIIGENLATQLSLYPMTFSLGVNVTF